MLVQTLKGFRDFLPKEARKREFVISTLKKVFSSYGFEPLETPALEYEEILAGKYGDEGEKLMYRFEDLGGRRVAMRYDQTVPLARVIAQYTNALPLPFKRYQIQNVYRAENTQKGRYREFLQVDIDTVGSSYLLADAEIISIAIKAYEALGFNNFKVKINDRAIFEEVDNKAVVILDKIDKIGIGKVKEELEANGLSPDLIDKISNKQQTENIKGVLKKLDTLGVSKTSIQFSPTLARGLDYYTGLIFEVKSGTYESGSLGAGGRYDDLIGIFSGSKIPAVGFSFGIDRIIEAMDGQNLFPDDLGGTKVLVTNTSGRAAQIANELREKNINAQLYVDEKDLDKQLRYADKKQIPYVLIVTDDKLELKDMKTGDQKEITLDQLPHKLQ